MAATILTSAIVILSVASASLIALEFLLDTQGRMQLAIRGVFESFWEAVKSSPIRELHRDLIRQFLEAIERFNTLLASLFDMGWLWVVVGIAVPVSFVVLQRPGGLDWIAELRHGVPLAVIAIMHAIFPIMVRRMPRFVLGAYVYVLFGAVAFLAVDNRAFLSAIFSGPVGDSFVSFVLLMPFLLVAAKSFAMVMSWTSYQVVSGNWFGREIGVGTYVFLLVAVIVSILVTYGAIFLGDAISERMEFALSIQVFLVNALCDFLTLTTTGLLLYAVVDRGFWLLPAIVLDVAVSALLAMCSLYFGLLGGPSEVTWGHAYGVLLGEDPAGTDHSFGSMFWVMHTTFLPTFLYLAIVVLGLMGKVFLYVPIEFVLRRLADREVPLATTGSFLGVVAGLLTWARSVWFSGPPTSL